MRIRVFPSSEAAGAAAAAHLADAVRRKPGIVIGLPTGSTPLPMYAELRRAHAAGMLDLSTVTTFNLDEFVGLDAQHPASFRHYMERELFRHVNVDPAHVHFLDGMATELDAECARYDREIAHAGDIDIQILGIGGNGHIGFNEPGDELIAPTHRVVLHEHTRRDNAIAFGGNIGEVPAEALSMGMGAILRASEIVLLATGKKKAECVLRAINGPLTTRLPASFLQTHRSVECYLDREAAARLPHRS